MKVLCNKKTIFSLLLILFFFTAFATYGYAGEEKSSEVKISWEEFKKLLSTNKLKKQLQLKVIQL